MMTHKLGFVMEERWPSAGPQKGLGEGQGCSTVLDVQRNCSDVREAAAAPWGGSLPDMPWHRRHIEGQAQEVLEMVKTRDPFRIVEGGTQPVRQPVKP